MATTASDPKSLLLTGAISTTLVATMMGKFGEYFWLLDLFSHFTMQYFCLNFIFFIIVLVLNKKHYLQLLMILLIFSFNLANLLPFYQVKNSARTVSSKDIKIVSLNINSQNKDWKPLSNYLKEYNPDIIILTELTPAFGADLGVLKNIYPFGKAVMDDGNFGIGIISKIPLDKTEIHRQSSSQIPFITTEIKTNSTTLNIVAIHPFPPLGSEGTLLRNDYLDQVSQFIQKSDSPTILCGDFNATPWSYPFKKMMAETKLTLPLGSGVIATWPTSLPFLRIPIDHCLTSPTLHILNYSRGPNVGSDHFPFQMRIDF